MLQGAELDLRWVSLTETMEEKKNHEHREITQPGPLWKTEMQEITEIKV